MARSGVVSAVSGAARFVAFSSNDPRLVAREPSGGIRDVFVRDRRTGRVRLISLASNGRQGNEESDEPAISANGRRVAFISLVSNLVRRDGNGIYDVFVRDRRRGRTTLVSRPQG